MSSPLVFSEILAKLKNLYNLQASNSVDLTGITTALNSIDTKLAAAWITTLTTAIADQEATIESALQDIETALTTLNTYIAAQRVDQAYQQPETTVHTWIGIQDEGFGPGVYLETFVFEDPDEPIGAITLVLDYNPVGSGGGTFDCEVAIPLGESDIIVYPFAALKIATFTQLATVAGSQTLKVAYVTLPVRCHALSVKCTRTGAGITSETGTMELIIHKGPQPKQSVTNDWVAITEVPL
jgi:hypothetical protein